jgi:hypothetical protein
MYEISYRFGAAFFRKNVSDPEGHGSSTAKIIEGGCLEI